MSGPGGTSTKRDQRRETRRQQFEARRVEREKARKRARRNQQIKRAVYIGVPILIIAIFVLVAIGSGGGSAGAVAIKLAPNGHPATGQTVDGLTCGQEQVQVHYHEYIAMYANGHPVNIPAGIGIVSPSGDSNGGFASNGNKVCLYPVHVHPNDRNVVHIESPASAQFTLGQFFDLFGQPLSSTQVAGYTADASHPLVYETIAENGTAVKYTGDPRNLVFDPTGHETVVILYNSPNVHPKAFTNWQTGE